MNTVTHGQILLAALAVGIPAAAIVEPSDLVYRPCRLEWLMGDYHRWFMRAIEQLGVSVPSPEDGDCDDFTDMFCTLARIAHRRTMKAEGLSGAALPIGRMNFLLRPDEPVDNKGKHAIAWAYTDRGLVFPEPQVVGKTYSLTLNQTQSCSRFSD